MKQDKFGIWLNHRLVGVIASLGVIYATGPALAQESSKSLASSPRPVSTLPTAPQKNTPGDIPAPTVTLKPGETPAIKFDTQNWDFGRVKSGTEVVHDFWFTNTGTGPLEILHVKPGCGCTKAGDYDRIVKPGESGRIPLKMHTAKTSGRLTKATLIYTNIVGEGNKVQIQMTGETWLPLEISPRAATVGRLSRQQAAKGQSVKLTLVSNVNQPVKIGGISSSNPAFQAEVSELEAGQKYEMTVTLRPAAADQPYATGNLSGMITFATGLDDTPTMEIPVNAFVMADVEVTPESLVLFDKRTVSQIRPFVVRNNSDQPLKISEVAASNPQLKVTMNEAEPGKTFRIGVDVPPEYQPASGDKIAIRTNNSTMPEIVIPISLTPEVQPQLESISKEPLVPASAPATVSPAAQISPVKPAT